jgi:urease accessory protein
VLDQMLVGLGLTVEHHTLPFEPESGAYHSHGH